MRVKARPQWRALPFKRLYCHCEVDSPNRSPRGFAAMKNDVHRFIEALVGAELMAERNARESGRLSSAKKPVVTISRSYGAMGKVVAQALADRLQVRCFDRTILEEIAHRARVDIDLVRTLDERVKQAGSD